MAGVKFLADLTTSQPIQFQNTSGENTGKISMNGDDLIISNAVGDVLFGDTGADIYIGDGVNSVDLLFEQSGAIKADDAATGVTLTLGSSNTTLNLYNPQVANGMTLTSALSMGSGSSISGEAKFTGATTFTGSIGNSTTTVPSVRVGLSSGNDPQIQFTDSGYNAHIDFGASSGDDFDVRIIHSAANTLDIQGAGNSGLKVNNQTVWNAGNDGSGSGLDADTVDGLQASSLLRSDAVDSFTASYLAFPSLSLGISNNNSDNGYGTYFRGSNTHFVLGLSSGNTLYLNYGNSSGTMRTYGTWYHGDTQILSTSRALTNVTNTNWDAAYTYSQVGHVPLSGGSMTGKLEIAKQSTHVAQGSISASNAHLDLYNNWQSDTDQKGSIITFTDNYLDGSNYNKTLRAAIKGGTDTTGNTADGYLEFYTDSAGADSPNLVLRLDKFKNATFYNNINAVGTVTGSNLNISNWNTAYGWGDHSTEGYLTTVAWGDVTGTPTTLAGYGITDADNYGSWNLKTNNVQRTTVQSGGTLDIVGGTNVSVSYSAGGVVTIASTDTNTTYSAGSGLTLTGTTFAHADTSTQASVNNSGRTYIQDITLDNYGHITAITSATETVVNTDTNYYLNGITKSGNTLTFAVNGTTNQTYTFGSNAFTSTNIPQNVSELTNDAGYITDGNTNWNNSYGFITASSTDTLTNKSGNISQWTNDSGYITSLAGYATESYVNTAVSNLVDSAPAALDTLNELAAALGDDANFSTTMSTALGNRLRVDTASQGLTSTQKSNARANLGLGTAATTNSTAYATAAQGTNADTAHGWGNHASAGYLTTVAFGDITGTPTTLAGYGITDAFDGAYGSLTGVPSTFTPSTHTHAAGDITSGTFAAARIPSLDASKISSGTLNAARLPRPVSGDWWNGGAAVVGTDGVMEIGKYIDFHDSDTETSDFSYRMTATNTNMAFSGTITATGYNDANWNTAYGWGDHSTQGYLTSFDITTQTDGKYLRSNANDSFSGTLSWGGSAGSDALDLNNSDIEDARGVRAREFTQLASGEPRNNLGSPTVTEMALFEPQFTCKTDLSNDYNDLTDLTFWVQSTSSSSWVEQTETDDQKRRFLRTNNSSIDIPNGAYKFRVEFHAKSYTFANALYMYWSSQSHNTTVHVYAKRCSDGQWISFGNSSATVSSWPGHLYLPFSTIPWLENNTTSTGHYSDIRIEFTPNWSGHATYGTYPIRLSGGQIWGGYPTGRRTPHYYDQNGKLNTWGSFRVSDKLEIDTLDTNTSSTTALVMNSNEVEKRTLGSLAFVSSVNAATITDNSVGAAELNVSGNGTSGQVLTSDGDGTFSWTNKTTNTDTNYYLNGITKSGNTLTFSVNGATNQSYTFGSNAFTSYTDHSTQGYLTTVAFGDITGTPTTLAGYGITDAFDGAYSSLSGAPTNVSSFTNDSGYLTAHPNITAASSSNNSGRTYIQDITLDSNGHVTGIATATETVTNTDTNYYLNGITKSGNTLTFAVNGAANQTYTFGSNAFNSTTIPTNNNQLTNGAGYVTGIEWNEIGGAQSEIQVSGFNNDAGYLTAHPNITAASSVNNSGRTYIQDITVDSNGHVTGITSATETVVNTDTTYSAGTGLDLSGTTFSVEPDLRDGITHVGKDANNYIQFDSTNGRIDFYAGGVFVARLESDGDLHVKGDVIAFSSIFA